MSQEAKVLGREAGVLRARAASWLAWSMLALAVLFGGLGGLLFFLNGRSPSGDTWYTLAFSAFPLVGGVIAARRPRNPIGCLFCTIGLANGLFFFSDEYVIYALAIRPGVLPGAAWLAWSQLWTVFVMWALMFFCLLLFPTGRLPSRPAGDLSPGPWRGCSPS